MNRKAVATGSIVVIILGFLVLLLILNGPLKTGYDYAQEKFFGKRGILSGVLPSRESEFQPYSGQIQLSSEEKIVDDSVKAFICAANSLALGKPGWLKKDVCPAGFQNATPGCSGALYGQSCVECSTSQMKEINFDTSDVLATKQLVDEVISCWDKFKANNFEDIWCSKLIAPMPHEVTKWDISGTYFKSIFEARGRKDINWGWLDMAGFSTRILFAFQVYVCGQSADMYDPYSKPEVLVTLNKNACNPKIKPKENEFTCFVKDFELPQKLGSSIFPFPANLAQDIMEQYIDPKYLVYYEEFPVAEASAWQINPGSFIIDVVLIGAGLNVIPAVGHYGKGIFAAGKSFLKAPRSFITSSFNRLIGRESKKLANFKTTPEMYEALFKRVGSQDIAAEFGEAALREVVQGSSSAGYEILLRSERLYVDVFDALRGRIPGYTGTAGVKAAEELSEKVREVVLKKYRIWPESSGKMPNSEIDRVSKSISDDVLKEVDDVLGTNVLKDPERFAVRTAVDKFVANPLTSAELLALKNQQVVKQFFVKYLIKESGEGLSEEGLNKVFAQAFSKELFESLDSVAAKEVSERTVGYVNSIIDEKQIGEDMWRTYVLGTSAVTPDLEKVVVAIGDANTQNIQNFFTSVNSQNVQNLLIGTSFKDFSEFTTALKAAPARYNPLYLTWAGKTFLIPGDVALWSIMKSTAKSAGGTLLYKLPVAGGRLVNDFALRPRIARIALSYIIGSAIAKADATNEKYRTKGGDSIVLQKPYYYDKNKVYSLSADTSDFFLGLLKFDNGKNGLSRFFMVSPCKADLMISRTKCACDYGNGDYLLLQEDTTQSVTQSIMQPISPNSIIPKSADAFISWHIFDNMTDSKQKQAVSECAQWGNADTFSAKCGHTMATNPEAYNKFLNYTYNKVYVPAVKFLANYGDNDFAGRSLMDLLDEKVHARQSVGFGLADFVIMRVGGYSMRSIYEKDIDRFPAFYVVSGRGRDTSFVPRLFASLLVESGPLEPRPSDTVVFRKTPLNFNEFKTEFESNLFNGPASTPIPEIYMTIVNVNKEYPRAFTDLFNQNQFFWAAANNTLLNYYMVYDFRIDKTKVVKQCDMSSMSAPDISNVMLDFNKGRSVVNCFSAQAALDSGYNNGNNYCFTGDISYIANAKWIATGLAVALDLGMAIGTGGTSAFISPAFTGFVAAWAGHEIDKAQWWPHH